MGWHPYLSGRRRRDDQTMKTWELIVSVVMFAIVIGTLVVFLLVFHDVPFRAA